jgi:hypothetical protein
MHVQACVDVVEQVPAKMIGILVEDEVIPAIPAPIHEDGPVQGRDFQIRSSRKPKPVAVPVGAEDAVTILRTDIFNVSMVKGMIQIKPRIVRAIVSIPLIVIDMRRVVEPTIPQVLHRGSIGGVASAGRRRDVPLVRSWRHLAVQARMLREDGD